MRVQIVEDNPALRDGLADLLCLEGYACETFDDGHAALSAFEALPYDIVLLDVVLPGLDGLDLCRRFRDIAPETQILILSARGDAIDRRLGLEMGADDYLGKPVDLRELEARIKAILRRGSALPDQAGNKAAEQFVQFGAYRLDLEAAKLTDAADDEVPLTAMEFRLLKLFAENRSRVLNRDQILEQAHDRSWDPYDRSIDIRISRLRRKIEVNPQKPTIIRTVRGIGYVFDPES